MIARRILIAAALSVAAAALAGCARDIVLTPDGDPADLGAGPPYGDMNFDFSALEGVPDPSMYDQGTLSRLDQRRDEREQAERVYGAMVEESASDPAHLHRQGLMRANEGDLRGAEECLARALELDPRNVDVLNDVAYVHYFQNRRDEAETVLRRALRIRPNDPAICSNLGMLLGEQGRDRQALMTFRRSGTDAEAHANMGFVYVQRGEFERARESYRRALSLDRNLRPAAEALEQLAQYESTARHVPAESRVLASRWQLTTTVAPVLGTQRQFVPWEAGAGDRSQSAYPVQTVSYDQPGPADEGGRPETEPRVPNRPSRFWLRLAGVLVE